LGDPLLTLIVQISVVVVVVIVAVELARRFASLADRPALFSCGRSQRATISDIHIAQLPSLHRSAF